MWRCAAAQHRARGRRRHRDVARAAARHRLGRRGPAVRPQCRRARRRVAAPGRHAMRGRRFPAILPTMAAALCAAAAPGATAHAAALPAAWLYDPAAVAEIDVTLAAGSRDALRRAPMTYAPATIAVRTPGRTVAAAPGRIRLKGSTSFRDLDGKAAFKLRFDSGHRPDGVRTLTLNNMVQDPSMVHELLAYTAFAAVGLPAPRVGYAFVRLDGEPYGLYANVETYEPALLARYFPATTHLYEAEGPPSPPADAVPGMTDAFELDQGPDDRTDLERLAALAATPGEGWARRVAPALDVPALVRYLATERYVGQFDGYAGLAGETPSNVFFHAGPDGVFSLLPWGMDQAFRERIPYGAAAGGALAAGCQSDPACLRAYADAVHDVRTTLATAALDELAQRTAALLAPWQERDPRREHSLAEIAAAVEATVRFARERPADADLRTPRPGRGSPSGRRDPSRPTRPPRRSRPPCSTSARPPPRPRPARPPRRPPLSRPHRYAPARRSATAGGCASPSAPRTPGPSP
ncbi:hypothetical protein GKE82_12980 [Conexibacter sp. W3-3-2]|nr:hypothetical protein [Conexibacter sp. W3-3-2]